MSLRKQIIRLCVSDKFFTDRQEFPDYFYEAARQASRKRGVFWSDHKQLDDLLTYLGLRKLPEILDEKQKQRRNNI